MKRNNTKGFTIVELVIVIAVIGILAAVMIPTFSGVVADAQKNAALQEAQNVYKKLYAEDLADGQVDSGESNETYTYAPENEGQTNATEVGQTTGTPKTIFTYKKGDYTVTFNGSTWDAKKD